MSANMKTLESLFLEAKKKDPGADRDQFMAEIEERDSELGADLRDLMKADARSERVFGGLSALGGGVDRMGETMVSADSPLSESSSVRMLRVGSQIGPYKLLEPIGEGGMGLVYLAQQSQPVRRKVALKIIKPGMD